MASDLQPTWVQFRLTTLLLVTAQVAALVAWWQDHSELQSQVTVLERQQRKLAVDRYDLAARRIADFAMRHGGTVSTDSVRWMLVKLDGRPVSDEDLRGIVDDIKALDNWSFTVPRYLGLYRTRVTEGFARQLAAQAPHWEILTTRPLRREDVPAVSR